MLTSPTDHEIQPEALCPGEQAAIGGIQGQAGCCCLDRSSYNLRNQRQLGNWYRSATGGRAGISSHPSATFKTLANLHSPTNIACKSPIYKQSLKTFADLPEQIMEARRIRKRRTRKDRLRGTIGDLALERIVTDLAYLSVDAADNVVNQTTQRRTRGIEIDWAKADNETPLEDFYRPATSRTPFPTQANEKPPRADSYQPTPELKSVSTPSQTQVNEKVSLGDFYRPDGRLHPTDTTSRLRGRDGVPDLYRPPNSQTNVKGKAVKKRQNSSERELKYIPPDYAVKQAAVKRNDKPQNNLARKLFAVNLAHFGLLHLYACQLYDKQPHVVATWSKQSYANSTILFSNIEPRTPHSTLKHSRNGFKQAKPCIARSCMTETSARERNKTLVS